MIGQKRSGPGPDLDRTLGPVHSPAGPGPKNLGPGPLCLDLDLDLGVRSGSGPGSAGSWTDPWTV